ncbi:hypothetical protein P9112_000717 [Eukaryota sp. TZLM1-RC]
MSDFHSRGFYKHVPDLLSSETSFTNSLHELKLSDQDIVSFGLNIPFISCNSSLDLAILSWCSFYRSNICYRFGFQGESGLSSFTQLPFTCHSEDDLAKHFKCFLSGDKPHFSLLGTDCVIPSHYGIVRLQSNLKAVFKEDKWKIGVFEVEKTEHCNGCRTAVLTSLAKIGDQERFSSFVINSDTREDQRKALSVILSSSIDYIVIFIDGISKKHFVKDILEFESREWLSKPSKLLFVVTKFTSSPKYDCNNRSAMHHQPFFPKGERAELSFWNYHYNPYNIPGFFTNFESNLKNLCCRFKLPELENATSYEHSLLLYVGVLVFRRSTDKMKETVGYLIKQFFTRPVGDHELYRFTR